MAGKTVLILGGGIGGIVTANTLQEQLSKEHRIMIVDRQSEYVFTPSLLWVMAGWRQPAQIIKNLRQMVHPDVELLKAEVQEIDPKRAVVRADDEELAYDYLVVALGADLAPEAMPGFSEAAHTPYNLEGATSIWEDISSFESGRVAVLVSTTPYKCPAAPYEAAMLLDDNFRQREIRDQVEIAIYTPEPAPMGVAGPDMGKAVVSMLEDKEISYNPELNPIRIDAEKKELVFENREPSPFDLLVGVPPHKPPQVVRESPLANETGWILVEDNFTLTTRFENVYAIGDVTAITLPNGKPLPKAGVFAEREAKAVAQRIAAVTSGVDASAEFDGVGFCWIEQGAGQAGFASGYFYAEPEPKVGLPHSGKLWHWGKVLIEQYRLEKGFKHYMARWGLKLGAWFFRIPASL